MKLDFGDGMAAIGLLVLILSLLLRRDLGSRTVIDLSWKGFALKADAFGLLLLLAAAAIGLPAAIHFLDLNTQITAARMERDESRAALAALGNQTVSLNLVFPSESSPNVIRLQWKGHAFVTRRGVREEIPHDDHTRFIGGKGGIQVELNDLHLGDLIRIELVDGARRWISASVPVGNADLAMQVQENP